MVISRLPSGGGGSKELHGAIINVSTGASLVGQTVYLYKSDNTEVAHKVVPSTKAVSFTDVQEVDTYTIKVTYQTKEYSDDIEITAEDIVDKNTFSASILGASVTVTTTEATLSGQKVELYLVDGSTETKVSEGNFSTELSYKFESIFTSGSYKAKSGEFESDEVAISDDDISQNANKNIVLSTSVTLTLTLEGACEDNIKIYDSSDTQVASCVFASGQTTGTVELTIPAEGGTYKFESTVAKDTTSGTANYTKNVNLTATSSDIKVMPDGALYWYGNECNSVTGGWTANGYSYVNDRNANDKTITKTISSIYVTSATSYVSVFGPSNEIDYKTYTKIKYHSNLSSVIANGLQILYSSQKYGVADVGGYTTQGNIKTMGNCITTNTVNSSTKKYPNMSTSNVWYAIGNIYAIWLE